MQTCGEVKRKEEDLLWPEAVSLRFTFWAKIKIKAPSPSSSLTEHNPITPRRTCTSNQGGRTDRGGEKREGRDKREWRWGRLEGGMKTKRVADHEREGGKGAEGDIGSEMGWEWEAERRAELEGWVKCKGKCWEQNVRRKQCQPSPQGVKYWAQLKDGTHGVKS